MTEDIKINAISSRIRYIGDGITNTFSYLFPIFENKDMNVYIDDVLQSSGYTISGAGNSNGGEVKFNTAPTKGQTITLLRNLEIKRTSDFQESGAFRAKAINHELDYQIACLQQLSEQLNRTITFPPYSQVQKSISLPVPQAGKALIWNDTESGLCNSTESINILEAKMHEIKDIVLGAQDEIFTIRDETQSLKEDTISIKNDTYTIKTETVNVKNDIITINENIETLKDIALEAASSAQESSDIALNAANEAWGKISNVGDIFYTSRLEGVVNGAVECNGGTYNTSDFTGTHAIKNLFNSGKLPYVSLSSYNSTINKSGVCYAFGWNGETDFRVPTIPSMQDTNTGIEYRAMIQLATGTNDETMINVTSALEKLGTKADINLGNTSPSSSFKTMSTNWSMPNYSGSVAIGQASLYIAPSDGYYYGQAKIASGTNSTARLGVEIYNSSGTKIFYYVNSCYHNNSGDDKFVSIFIPVPKGCKITVTRLLGTLVYSNFIPVKGV